MARVSACARRAGFAVTAALLWCAGAAAQDAEPDRGAELDELRGVIEDSRQRVGDFELRERALFDLLEEIDHKLDVVGAQVRAMSAEARQARATLRAAELRVAALEERLAETRAAMRARVTALYKAGETGPVRLLFSSTSLRELLARVSTLRLVVERDSELVVRFGRERDAQDAARTEARRASERRDQLVVSLAEQRRVLARERGARKVVLAAVHRDRTQERAVLVELEKAARALEETLTALGKTPRRSAESFAGSGFALLRGDLEAPVRAPIQQGFGRVVDAEFQTQTFRKGVEFAAAEGTSVRAVAPGEVRFAGWFRGYGKIVILDHGDQYFTVSGHLDEIVVEVGAVVESRDTIGSVGDTGSLAGASLYFEIRRGSESEDPADWLRAAAGG
ncbi:MAG: peptidoglycan DD-metalloendopeptidase family protein [Proteobacteria bacterium]|nr:peptidoglycan DD-metalloendopeptidase family protein [Pseudomonadota bacterium]